MQWGWARKLWDVVDTCELIDLGFIGPRFTRSMRDGLANIKE